MNEEEKNELFYRTGDKVSIAVMQLYSLRLLSQISNASRCGHALSGAIELQHRLVPIESPIPVASGHFGRCTVGFIHKLCGWIRFIFAPICKQKHHTCKISAQVLDTTLTCIIRGVLMWKKKIYCRPKFFFISDLLKISIKCCFAFTHHHPLTSPPLFCSCWRQACLCSRGHSVDLQVWHFLLAAPCGETRSRGPCAPSGFSIDLNNCKTQKRFAKHKKGTFWTFECHTLCKTCLA